MIELIIGGVAVYLITNFLSKKETPEQLLLNRKEVVTKVLQYYNFVIIFARQNALTNKESYILGMIAQESLGDPNAKGAIGEIGLMQITRGAMQDVNDIRGKNFKIEDLEKPVINIEVGVAYLAIQKGRMYGDLFKAIQSYNAGAEAVRKNSKAGLDYLDRVLKWREDFKSYDK